MCGIAGIFYFDRSHSVEPALLDAMTDSLTHRGPDDRGVYIDGSLGLGFRRLSIIDLSPLGHQPMSNEDGTVWIVFNGEIYNYQSLRPALESAGHRFKSRTDTEVIIHAYEEYGEACLDHLDGMFAFALWDSKTRSLFVARDRFGIKPLHYSADRTGFYFGSEIKAILRHPGIPRAIDHQALSDFLTFMQVPAPRTIYGSVKKLLPGHALQIGQNGVVREWQYWDIAVVEDERLTEEDHVRELDELFRSAVRRHLIADVPVGVYLSGGFDSSSIAAYASMVSSSPVKTFSVSFSSDEGYDESRYQKLVSEKYNTEHHVFHATPDILTAATLVLRECDEPFAVGSAIPLYYISKMASEHVKVVLSGDGSDELFAGYSWRYRLAQRAAQLSVVPTSAWKTINGMMQSVGGVYGQHLPGIFRKISKASRLGAMNRDEQYVSIFSIFQRSEKNSILDPDILRTLELKNADQRSAVWEKAPAKGLNRNLYFDIKTSLADEMMTKADRCSSMVSIEGRVPFLDKAFAEKAMTIPARFKLTRNDEKYIVKRAFAHAVPNEIITRPKQGFSFPLGKYLTPRMLDVLRNDVPPFINKKSLQRLIDIHQSGKLDMGSHLWNLEILRLWYGLAQEKI